MRIPLQNKSHTPLEASKWQKTSVLLLAEDVAKLLEELAPCTVVSFGQVVRMGEEIVCLEKFLEAYKEFSEQLFSGTSPNTAPFRRYFFSVFTKDINTVFSVPIESAASDDRQEHIIKLCRPSLQLQILQVRFSKETKTLYQNVFGTGTMALGLTFSYPHLVKTGEGNVIKGREEINSDLFKKVQKWVRHHTEPAHFSYQGEKIASTIRWGNGVKEKIAAHPYFKQMQLEIL